MVKKPVLALLALCVVLLIVLITCQRLAPSQPASDSTVKMTAVELAATAFSVLDGRLPGPEYSLITTTLGSEDAKRLSLHPDFAAVAVDLLRQAGVRPGDRVAVNVSGSFPGLNISVLSAIKALDAQPLLISSVGASTWGATDPFDTWLDMERSLEEAGLPWRSLAASPGGVGDHGGGLSKEGLALIHSAIHRNNVPELASTSVTDGIARRLVLYRDANGRLPAVLVNVGGSHVIFGSRGHAATLRQGITHSYRAVPSASDNLAAPFLAANRPVIHFINIRRLAARYQITADSPPGSAGVFREQRLSPALRTYALISLASAAAALWQGRRRGIWQPTRRSSIGS